MKGFERINSTVKETEILTYATRKWLGTGRLHELHEFTRLTCEVQITEPGSEGSSQNCTDFAEQWISILLGRLSWYVTDI